MCMETANAALWKHRHSAAVCLNKAFFQGALRSKVKRATENLKTSGVRKNCRQP